MGESQQTGGQSTTVGDVSSIVKTAGNGDVEVIYGTKITKIGAEPVTCPICEVTFTGEYFKCPRCKRDHIHEKHQVASPDYYKDYKLICQECYEKVEEEHQKQIIEGFINDGNQALSEGKFREAIQYYQQAIQNGAEESVLSSNIEECSEKLRMEIEERAKKADIWKAVENDDVDLIEFYIEQGADINQTDDSPDQKTLLHIAAEHDSYKTVELLLQKGAYVDTITKEFDDENPFSAGGYSETALITAVNRRSINVAKLLIEYGADIEATDNLDFTPILMAAFRADFEMLKFLLEKGANIIVHDKYGHSLLREAVADHTGQNRENIDIVRLLVEHGVEIDEDSISHAVENNYLKILDLLLRNCSDNSLLSRALRRAILGKRLDLVKLLIRFGADVKGEEGTETPLMLAVRTTKEIVRLLLENGADPNSGRDSSGETALHNLAHYNDQEKIEMAEMLIENGADIEAKHKWEATPLYEAGDRKNKEFMEMLLKHRANINATNRFGKTILDEYCDSYGNYDANDEFVKFLLSHGAVKTRNY